MQIMTMQDPSLGPGVFDTGIAAQGGKVIMHNISPFDLLLTFGGDETRQAVLMAWQPREFDFCGKRTETVKFKFLYAPATTQINAPTSIVFGEAYAPGEPTPLANPNYDRLSNLGNQLLPTSSTPAVFNDGNPPGTEFIESTPSDQSNSAIGLNNDGSAHWTILSAGVLRSFLSIVRGTIGPVEAQVVIGDVNDPSMTVLHGTADSAATAGFATTAGEAATTQQVAVYDGGIANINNITQYEGTVDPSTYLIPADGDIWYQG